MKKLLYIFLFIIALLPLRADAQFILNNSATITTPECSDSTTTYQLTPAAKNLAGEIWYTTQFNLNNKFDIQFEMFLGTQPYTVGADGICFVFQQQSTNAGSTGGGLGYGGIAPSIAVEFDTYKNAWDPAYCHTSIEKNGDVNHTDLSGNQLAGPVQLDPANPNLPDNQWHNMEIVWFPKTQTMNVYYDCILRTTYTGDIINSIFGGNPNVYWGFTAGTGSEVNVQEVCVANSYLNNLRDTTICAGKPVTITAKGGVSYTWSPNLHLNKDTGATIIASPDSTTTYTVVITNQCGFKSRDSITISVEKKFTSTISPLTDTICPGKPVKIKTTVASGKPIYKYVWNNGVTKDSASITVYPTTTTTYIVNITDGCKYLNTDSMHVVVYPKVIASFIPIDSIYYGQTATFINTSQNASSYYWTFGDGANSTIVSPTHLYGNVGIYEIQLIGNDRYGCPDTTVEFLRVLPEEILIPNVFTPNGDLKNDILYFTITGTKCFHVDIFNRWGQLVYQSDNERSGWNGKVRQTNDNAPDGTYYYILNYCDFDNVTHKLDGYVQLIR